MSIEKAMSETMNSKVMTHDQQSRLMDGLFQLQAESERRKKRERWFLGLSALAGLMVTIAIGFWASTL